MSKADVFALQKTGLDAFLFADVGSEANGAPLTMLSVLARLGKDPWAEAALWANQPTLVAVDALTATIQAIASDEGQPDCAHATASRLVILLPKHTTARLKERVATATTLKLPPLGWLMLACLWLYFLADVGLALGRRPNAVAATLTATASSVPGAHGGPPDGASNLSVR